MVNRRHLSEQDLLRLFRGTCLAIRAMHSYRVRPGASQLAQANGSPRHPQPISQRRHSDDDERFPQPDDDGEGGFSYDAGVTVPLVTKHRVDEGDVVFDGDQELDNTRQEGDSEGELVPYAHRDIKPGYVNFVSSNLPRT